MILACHAALAALAALAAAAWVLLISSYRAALCGFYAKRVKCGDVHRLKIQFWMPLIGSACSSDLPTLAHLYQQLNL